MVNSVNRIDCLPSAHMFNDADGSSQIHVAKSEVSSSYNNSYHMTRLKIIIILVFPMDKIDGIFSSEIAISTNLNGKFSGNTGLKLA